VLQPTEMYVILSSLLVLPGMIVLVVLALTGTFDRIESVKYMALVAAEPPYDTDGPSAEVDEANECISGRRL